MAFATWIVVGFGAAWVASVVMKHGGHGLTADILLGLTGSGAAYGIAWSFDMLPQSAVAATSVIAGAGAGAAIALQRRFFQAPLKVARVPRRR